MWEKFRIRVFVISAYSRIVLRRILGAERTEDPLPDKGTRRKYAELKTAYFRRAPPEEVLGAERTEDPLPDKGTRRKYAELKTAYFRRVPQRKFWEQSGQKFLCQVRVLGGNMRNLNIEGRGQNGRK